MGKANNHMDAICSEHLHKWVIWNQGEMVCNNGTIPGTRCQCGTFVIIDRYCHKCNSKKIVVVKSRSKEAIDWFHDEGN